MSHDQHYLNVLHAGLLTSGKFEPFRRTDDDGILTAVVATNKIKGVNVTAVVSGGSNRHIVGTIKVRTTGSGYAIINRFFHHDWQPVDPAAIEKTVTIACDLLDRPLLDVVTMPPPFEFQKTQIEMEDGEQWNRGKIRRAVINCQIRTVSIMKIVSVDRGGALSDEISLPDTICWYLMDCTSPSGATFNVITDGEVFYPTTRITTADKKARLSTHSGKQSVDLQKMGPSDKDAINAVIVDWIERMSA